MPSGSEPPEIISHGSRPGARCARTSRLPLRRKAATEDNVDLSVLPTVNATLNGLATLLLIVGRLLIRKKRVDAHRRVMIGAFSVSTLFLGLTNRVERHRRLGGLV